MRWLLCMIMLMCWWKGKGPSNASSVWYPHARWWTVCTSFWAPKEKQSITSLQNVWALSTRTHVARLNTMYDLPNGLLRRIPENRDCFSPFWQAECKNRVRKLDRPRDSTLSGICHSLWIVVVGCLPKSLIFVTWQCHWTWSSENFPRGCSAPFGVLLSQCHTFSVILVANFQKYPVLLHDFVKWSFFLFCPLKSIGATIGICQWPNTGSE